MADALPIRLYCDGLAEPTNPGIGCWGWLALSAAGEILGEGQGCWPRRDRHTNNEAEYQAVLEALGWAWRAGYRAAIVRSDSQLVIQQASGAWGCSAERLIPLLHRVQRAASLMTLEWEWIPREANDQADRRSRLAYQQLTGCLPPDRPKRLKGARS